MSETPSVDPRFPGYLARVLDEDGDPVGTGFQVAPGVIVTAWHVLDELGAGDRGGRVRLDLLSGGEAFAATVERVAPPHDLGVMSTDRQLPASVPGLVASDSVAIGTGVVVQGVASIQDPGHEHSRLSSSGSVEGPHTQDGIPLLRIKADAVTPGMSGAPVRRGEDGHVLGVVSGRYNSPDTWLEHSVWVVRTEELAPLLEGLAEVRLEGRPALSGAVDLVLSVSESEVRLTGPGIDAAGAVSGVSLGLSRAVDEVRRARAYRGASDAGEEPAERPTEVALSQVGEFLAREFLPEPVARALREMLGQAIAAHVPLRLGVEAEGSLSRLPWEALPNPIEGRALGLHPLVNLYRRVESTPVQPVPGPLRILVAIASPEDAGPVLDYEHELRNVIEAARSARQGAAHVREVEFATTAAIRAALDAEPFHVLHLSGHGSPGRLVLEDEQGNARTVDADEFVDDAIPPGRMPPMVVLSACYTDVAPGRRPRSPSACCSGGRAWWWERRPR